jgi:hypothetical protein
MKPKNIVINNMDDFIDEMRMLPDLNRRLVFHLDPLEDHLMSVAEKHGVFDNFDDEENYEFYDYE